MGVCGCGKTSIGKRLAAALGYPFLEGDTFHPPENVERMRRGMPLTDEDRAPWLAALAKELADRESAVLACSALKRKYRDQLITSTHGLAFLYLTAPREIITERLAARKGHYMPPDLLASQLAILEPPAADERCVCQCVTGDDLTGITQEALKKLQALL